MYYYDQKLSEEEGVMLRKPPSTTSTSTALQPSSTGTAEMDGENVPKKRDGPESCTAVMMPEHKRQKMEFVQKDLEFVKTYYQESMCRQFIQMDLQNDWHLRYNLMTSTTRHFSTTTWSRRRGSLATSSISPTSPTTMQWHACEQPRSTR